MSYLARPAASTAHAPRRARHGRKPVVTSIDNCDRPCRTFHQISDTKLQVAQRGSPVPTGLGAVRAAGCEPRSVVLPFRHIINENHFQ